MGNGFVLKGKTTLIQWTMERRIRTGLGIAAKAGLL